MTKKLELLMSKLECAVVDYKSAELEGTEAEYEAAEARLEEARMQLMQGFGEVPAGWKTVPAEPSNKDLAVGVRAMRLFVTKVSLQISEAGMQQCLRQHQRAYHDEPVRCNQRLSVHCGHQPL
jgi:hypothetical protein